MAKTDRILRKIVGVKMGIQINGNRAVVNGVSYNLPPGAAISIMNNTVYVNGQKFDPDPGNGLNGFLTGIIELHVYGDLNSLKTDGSVIVNGNVLGSINSGGSCVCGNVGGNVSAGGSIKGSSLGGNASAGGSVSINR